MTDELTPEQEDEALAAEYTLGLLTRAEAQAFDARLSVDPGFRGVYARWVAHLAGLFENTPPVAPPARVLAAIRAKLFPRRTSSLWQRIGLVPGIAGAALAAVVVFGLINLDALLPTAAQGPVYAASIAAEDNSLVVQAAFDVTSGTLTLERTAGSVTPGRSQELWLIAPGAEAPVSLGLLSDGATTTLTPSSESAAALSGGTLAISDEPPGGSPSGAPTGAVLATGVVTEA